MEAASGAWAAIDQYCERLGPGLWAEPLNAVSNAVFVLAALVAWAVARREGRADDWAVRALVGVEIVIGVGSALFHTFANVWSMAADVIPIMGFIAAFLYIAGVRFLGLPRWAAALGTVAFFPASVALGNGLAALVGPLNGSIAYVPVLLAILAMAAWLARAGHGAAGGLAAGGAMLAASLTFRTLDDQTGAVCAAFPIGTHWLWHSINGVMLAWMTVVVIRHGAPRALARGAAAE